MVTFFHRGHAGADLDDDTGALVPENRREQPFRIGAGQSEFVGVADARCLGLNQDLAGARTVELDGGDFKGFAGCKATAARTSMRSFPRSVNRARLSSALAGSRSASESRERTACHHRA